MIVTALARGGEPCYQRPARQGQNALQQSYAAQDGPHAKNDLAPDASGADVGKVWATGIERMSSASVKVKTSDPPVKSGGGKQGNMAMYWSGVEFKWPTGNSDKWREKQRFGGRQIQGQQIGEEVIGKGLDRPWSQELGLR